MKLKLPTVPNKYLIPIDYLMLLGLLLFVLAILTAFLAPSGLVMLALIPLLGTLICFGTWLALGGPAQPHC